MPRKSSKKFHPMSDASSAPWQTGGRVAGWVFIGYGSSIVYAICLTIVLSRSPEHKYGVTTSTFSMLSDTGTGLGPSIMGAVVALVGYRDMYVFGICVCAVSLAMYLCFHGIREARNEQARQGDMG